MRESGANSVSWIRGCKGPRSHSARGMAKPIFWRWMRSSGSQGRIACLNRNLVVLPRTFR